LNQRTGWILCHDLLPADVEFSENSGFAFDDRGPHRGDVRYSFTLGFPMTFAGRNPQSRSMEYARKSDSLLGLNEKEIYPLSLLNHFSTVGINEGNITGLLIAPHEIPDRRQKPVGVPKCKR
jgi:hypothetical protein